MLATIPAAPLGVLRILSRHDGAQVLILHGKDREVEAGERVALEEWFGSIETAQAVSHFCSARLMSAKASQPDPDGWHPYPVHALERLVIDAKAVLNLEPLSSADTRPRRYQAWTRERIARLAFLAGQGWTAKLIAADPLIRSTPDAVYRMAHRCRIALSEIPASQVSLRLPVAVMAHFQSMAAREQMTRDHLIRRLLISIAMPGSEIRA